MFGSRDLARAGAYHRLAVLLDAGVAVREAAARVAPGTDLAPAAAALGAGDDLSGALRASPDVPAVEAAVLSAADRVGAVPDALRDLAALLEERTRERRALALSLAYPVFLVHAAVLLPALPEWVSGGTAAFLRAALLPLAVGYVAVLGTAAALAAARRSWPVTVDAAWLRVPGLGRLLHARAVSAALRTFELLYARGVPIVQALEAACATTPNAAVAEAFRRIAAAVEQGTEVGAAFAAEPLIPPDVARTVASGAQAGKLDETLPRVRALLADEVSTRRTLLLGFATAAAFGTAALIVAVRVISFYTHYLQRIGGDF